MGTPDLRKFSHGEWVVIGAAVGGTELMSRHGDDEAEAIQAAIEEKTKNPSAWFFAQRVQTTMIVVDSV